MIPIMRTNGRDFDTILGVWASLSELTEAGTKIEKRIRSIPNGWRDYRCVIAKLEKLADDLIQTIPKEKLPNLQRMVRRIKFKMVVGPQACSTNKDETVVGIDDLDKLVTAARERCTFCTDWTRGKCDRCELGKVLDRVLRYDRNGNSWDSVSDATLEED